MEKYEETFHIGVRDIDSNLQITDKTILGLFEDTGSLHSDSIGCGVANLMETKLSWVIIHWKVEIVRRAKYGEKVTVRTWVAAMKKLYMYRQYEIVDELGNVIIKANSKWILTHLEQGAVKIPQWIVDGYGIYGNPVFDDWNIPKLKEPENPVSESQYVVPCSAIDFNGHMNNLYYLDVAVNAMDSKEYLQSNISYFEIMYKKESVLGETLKCKVFNDDNEKMFVVKTEDEKNLHAIVIFKSKRPLI